MLSQPTLIACWCFPFSLPFFTGLHFLSLVSSSCLHVLGTVCQVASPKWCWLFSLDLWTRRTKQITWVILVDRSLQLEVYGGITRDWRLRVILLPDPTRVVHKYDQSQKHSWLFFIMLCWRFNIFYGKDTKESITSKNWHSNIIAQPWKIVRIFILFLSPYGTQNKCFDVIDHYNAQTNITSAWLMRYNIRNSG